jgi:hypothetical protein
MKSLSRSLAILFSAIAAAAFLPSCVTSAPEKKYEYDFGDESERVSELPYTRPESFEGNPFGNMPQSR